MHEEFYVTVVSMAPRAHLAKIIIFMRPISPRFRGTGSVGAFVVLTSQATKVYVEYGGIGYGNGTHQSHTSCQSNLLGKYTPQENCNNLQLQLQK